MLVSDWKGPYGNSIKCLWVMTSRIISQDKDKNGKLNTGT